MNDDFSRSIANTTFLKHTDSASSFITSTIVIKIGPKSDDPKKIAKSDLERKYLFFYRMNGDVDEWTREGVGGLALPRVQESVRE